MVVWTGFTWMIGALARPQVFWPKKELWADWSEKVGLQENGAKTQFVANSAANTRKLILAGADANQISKDFEILGVQPAMQPRQVKKKEVQRLTTALVCVKMLSCLKLGFAKFHRAACSYSLSECVYGWISRTPTLAICKKWWAALRRGQKSVYAASPYLRGVLLGGLSHIDCVVAVNLLRVVHAL